MRSPLLCPSLPKSRRSCNDEAETSLNATEGGREGGRGFEKRNAHRKSENLLPFFGHYPSYVCSFTQSPSVSLLQLCGCPSECEDIIYVFGPKRAGALCRIWCTVSQRKNHERSEGRVFSAAGDLLRIMWLPFLPSSMQLQLSKFIFADY